MRKLMAGRHGSPPRLHRWLDTVGRRGRIWGQWRVARRLVKRGAWVGRLSHAAAPGMKSVIDEHFAARIGPDPWM
jgi:hypothetical protein